MTNLSHLISLPVYNIFEVRYEGTIENVLINTTTGKLKNLIIYDEENDLKKVVPFNKVYAINENGLTIKNSSCVTLYESVELQISKQFNPINSKAIKTTGEYLGCVQDVTFLNGQVQYFIINNIKTQFNKVLNFTNKLTILKSNETQMPCHFKIKKIKVKKTFNYAKEQNVNILTDDNKIITPQKAVINYNFLINRKVTKDIFSNMGVKIVKKDTIMHCKITADNSTSSHFL